MMERTLVLIKPDGIYRSLVGKIISTIEDTGLKVVAMKMVWPDRSVAQRHYPPDENWMREIGMKAKATYKDQGIENKEEPVEIGRRVWQQLLDYLLSGPVIALVFEGNDAIYIVRKLTGATEPRKADPGSIRGKFSSDSYSLADRSKRAVKNLIHASDSPEAAKREISIWFKENEIVNYTRSDEQAQY
ncbi:MAG: nucleoside-diphosphate kinase [Candidatus Micrarchaeaceae archaeon]